MADDKTAAERAAVDEFPDYSWHQVPQTVLALMRDAFVRGWAAHDAALLAAHPVTAIDRDKLARIIREGRQKWVGGGDGSYDLLIADALLASGVLNGQTTAS